MRHYIIAIAGVILLSTCGKIEQRQETNFTCTVTDVTTGKMTEKAGVFLYEYYTPPRPFAPIERNVVEYFEVDYGTTFSSEFNAKRGNGYEYVLEFDDFGGGFISGKVNPETYEPFYNTQHKCTLSKKSLNECVLMIEPTADVIFDADNPLDIYAEETDSLYWELTDGVATFRYTCTGIGGCTRGVNFLTVNIPGTIKYTGTANWKKM